MLCEHAKGLSCQISLWWHKPVLSPNTVTDDIHVCAENENPGNGVVIVNAAAGCKTCLGNADVLSNL